MRIDIDEDTLFEELWRIIKLHDFDTSFHQTYPTLYKLYSHVFTKERLRKIREKFAERAGNFVSLAMQCGSGENVERGWDWGMTVSLWLCLTLPFALVLSLAWLVPALSYLLLIVLVAPLQAITLGAWYWRFKRRFTR